MPNDPNAKLIADPDHSEEEDRFIILGISNNSKVLVVCHCYRFAVQPIVMWTPAT